jgi:hypothetical protein
MSTTPPPTEKQIEHPIKCGTAVRYTTITGAEKEGTISHYQTMTGYGRTEVWYKATPTTPNRNGQDDIVRQDDIIS